MNNPNTTTTTPTELTVATKREGVATFPVAIPTSALGLVEAVTLAKTTVLVAGSSQTAHFTMLVHGIDDPVDAGITTDSLVAGIHQNDFIVLVGGILVDPVGVQHTQVTTQTTDTLLSNGPQGALELQLRDTVRLGFAVCLTLGDVTFATTTTDTDAVDDVSLLGLE
jgi:hypothetical protein